MPIKIKIYSQKAEEAGEMELADEVFGLKANEALVHQVAVSQMGNERPVLAHTKDRSEVRGGGRKPWRQKGTGRARAGSNRSPIWKGGGVTFGPVKERNFKKNINKKMKQKTFCMVLSDRVNSGSLVVLDGLKMDEFKTKKFGEMLAGIEEKALTAKKKEKGASGKNQKKARRSILIVNDKKDKKTQYSGRNLAGVKIINLENINILDLLKYKNLILTKQGVKKLEKNYIAAKTKNIGPKATTRRD